MALGASSIGFVHRLGLHPVRRQIHRLALIFHGFAVIIIPNDAHRSKRIPQTKKGNIKCHISTSKILQRDFQEIDPSFVIVFMDKNNSC
jgi:hypothetical protein